MAGAAQDMPWLIAVRATQGVGAALMLPTTLAIVSAAFPERDQGGPRHHGRRLRLLRGARPGPEWAAHPVHRLAGGVPHQRPACRPHRRPYPYQYAPAAARDGRPPSAARRPGLIAFAVGIGALTLGLGQSQQWGWGSTGTLVALGLGLAGIALILVIEPRRQDPLVQFGLFRHLNFSAANVSQALAGSIELAAGYLLPFFLLLVVGLAPGPAGLALIPATVPVIVVAPLVGRWFDHSGGRMPLTVGFLVLACSSFALVAAFPAQSLVPLIPGLVLQGIGLGIVLTVNDPTGLGLVPADDQGTASGIVDTSEQLGGAVGIALFSVILLHVYFGRLYERLGERGITPTQAEIQKGREFVLRAEQEGIRHVSVPPHIREVLGLFEAAHVYAFQITFGLTGGVALVGAAVCWLLVRRGDHLAPTGIFSRRSRWV